jgi:RND family efflux transporter MFP subunit
MKLINDSMSCKPETREREFVLMLNKNRGRSSAPFSRQRKPMPRFVSSAMSVLALVITALFMTSCDKGGKEAAKTSQPPTVAVAKANVEDLSRDVVMTAEFRPYQEIEVMAKVAGYVKVIYVDIGDKVKKGQLLAVLEVPEMADDMARATSSLKVSEAEAARAREELHRAQSLNDIAHISYTRLAEVAAKRPGLVAQQEIDDARSKDLSTQAQVAAGRSSIESANEQIQVNRAALSRVKTMLDYTRVTAPFAGVVTKRFADVGAMIQAGTASQTQAMPLVRLSQNNLLRIIVPVPESAVPTIHIGQEVEVRVPTLKRSFLGKVTRFADKIATSTRTMDTEIDVPNANGDMVPGMYAEVRLNLDRRKGALAIPLSAVDLSGSDIIQQPKGGDSGSTSARKGKVMVVLPNNRIEIRNVSVGLETANKIEVLTGLKDGDLVVIGGRSSLQSGQEVRPKVTALGGAPS